MRLAAKLTLAFGAVTLLPLVPLTLLARQVIANRYREELHRTLEESVRQTERAYDEVARETERTAARLARSDDDLARELLRACTFAPGGVLSEEQHAALSDAASEAARARSLDVLLAVAADGTVLCAPGDPGREGAVESGARRAAARRRPARARRRGAAALRARRAGAAGGGGDA